MATIKGLTIQINGDTVGLNKALGEVNDKSRDLQSELKSIERLLKFDPENAELMTQKQKLLSESVDNTAEKLKTLKIAAEQANEKLANGEIGEDQYRALQREILKTEQHLESLETAAIKSRAVLSKEEALGNLKKIGTTVAAASAAAGAALIGMTAAAVNNADELQRQADVTGLSAERLQELSYAGNNLGVELSTITGAQAKLTKSMFAAKDGTSAQAAAFSALGISVLDGNLQMRDSKIVMEEAFTALNSVGNETERDQLAMQLFGKSTMEMNPLIKAGGDELNRLADEARKSGAVMSDEAVAGLDSFGDTVDNLKNGVLGAFGEKFAELLPVIQSFLSELQKLPQWISENATLLEIIAVVIGTIIALIIAYNIQQALMASGMTMLTAIEAAQAVVTGVLSSAFLFLTSPIALVILAIGALIAIGVLLYKNWDTVKEACLTAWNSITSGIKNATDKTIGFFSDLIGTLAALPGRIISIGSDIVKGLWDGISSRGDWLKGKFIGFIGKPIQWAKEVLGIHSPSRVFAGIGGYMAEGLSDGFLNSMSTASRDIKNAIPTDFENKISYAISKNDNPAPIRTETRYTIGGKIRVEGVTSKGDFVAAAHYAVEDVIRDIMMNEVRM